MNRAIAEAVRVHGSPDYLICSAGSSTPGYFLDQTMDIFRNTMELNYIGIVASVKATLPYMLRNNQGHLVLVSSAAAISGWIGYSSYCPSKYAVRGLADSLRSELKGSNIDISIAYRKSSVLMMGMAP